VSDGYWNASDTAGTNKYRCDETHSKCRLCYANNTEGNHPSSSGADGMCESGCGASASSDEKTPNACDSTNGWINSTCHYFDDGDSNQNTCNCIEGAGNYYSAGSGQLKCCGDDSTSDDFETDASTNWCCINGENVANNTRDSTSQFLCYEGSIYSCNSAGTFAFDTDSSSCGRQYGWYCDGAGSGADTWKDQITTGQPSDDCDGNNEDPYGEGHSNLNANIESCEYNKVFYDHGSGVSNQDKYWRCNRWGGPYLAYVNLSQSTSTLTARIDVADEADNPSSGGYVLRLGDYDTITNSGHVVDASYPGTLHYNPTHNSYSGIDSNEGVYGDYFDVVFTWNDLDVAITEEKTYYMEVGVEEASGSNCPTQTCDSEDPNDNEGGFTTSSTLCVPMSYSATADSDCCPIGGTNSEYPGKDDDDGKCVRCYTSNHTQREGATGNNLCEQKCGAPANSDEKPADACHATTAYINTTCGYINTADDLNYACACIMTGTKTYTNYWNIGGETNITICCENTTGEYVVYEDYNSSNLDSAPDEDDYACCSNNTDCNDDDTCRANTYASTDVDGDGDEDYCNSGQWVDCDTDAQCSVGYYCNASNDCESSNVIVTYQTPTPEDSSRQINNWVSINVSVSSSGSNVVACILEWEGVNETMQKIGSGTDVFCNITKDTNDGTDYTFKVYANNTVGTWGNESERTFRENEEPVASNIILNSTSGNNLTLDNLTVYITSSDSDGDSVTNITDWRKDGSSIAVLNMPFNTNITSTTSGAVRDYSTYENNGTLGGGTLANAPTWVSDGKVGGGYEFDGINDYINCGNDPSLNITDAITIEAWVKPDGAHGNYDYVLNKKEETKGYYLVSGTVDVDWLNFVVKIGETSRVARTNIFPPIGQWSHIVGSYDGSRVRVYMNGIEQTYGTNIVGNIDTTTNPLKIGAYGVGDAFNGAVDEVRIHNRALSPEQINASYQAGLANHSVQTMVSDETSKGEIWSVAVTPNDQYEDGATVLSNNLTIENTPPNLISIADTHETLEPGQTQIITPSGQDDADHDTLNLVCCKDDNNTCAPTNATNICAGGNWQNQAHPYSSMNCTYAVGTVQGTEYVRCKTYDGTNYSEVANESYTIAMSSPTNLTATTITDKPLNSELGKINLTWTDNSDEETGFKIERSVDNSTYSQIDTTGANVATYLDDNSNDNTLYYYRVRSYKGIENSTYSNIAFNTTSDRTGPDSPDLTVTADNTNNEMELNWTQGDDGLVLYMPFEEGSGTTTDDWSGEGNGGTFGGDPTWTTGKSGNGDALEFDGSDDKITAGTTGRPTNTFTFGGWMKTSVTHQIDIESTSGTGGTSGQKYAFGAAHGGGNAGVGLSVGTNGISVYEHGSNYMPALAVYDSTIGSDWNHIIVVYDNKQPTIYLN
ncbi:MAG: hypothetical protein KAU95_02655, partial [Candidatus Aenigmarchaeota archaeon]|nr:hypothetical protein [Candidatus Aenigmarchaeota archaeon]